MSKPLTIKEAAARLGKTPEALRLWRKAGKGPRWIMSGGKPVYPPDAFAEFMTKGEEAGQAANDRIRLTEIWAKGEKATEAERSWAAIKCLEDDFDKQNPIHVEAIINRFKGPWRESVEEAD